jgi:hypothetical protein
MNIARGLISRLPQMAGGVSALAVAGAIGYGAYNSIYTGKKILGRGCFSLPSHRPTLLLQSRPAMLASSSAVSKA